MFSNQDEQFGAINRPEIQAPTFGNPLLATTAAGYLAALAAGRAGVFQAIKQSSRILTAQGAMGNAARGIGNAFRAAQISTMIPVSTSAIQRKAMLANLDDTLGRHSDV